MTSPLPAGTPTVTIARTREDGYQLLRLFVLASGADEADGTVDILPGPCGTDMDPRQRADGYYSVLVLGGFRAVGDDQHEAFGRMHEFALRNRFRVGSYRNPPSEACRSDAIGQWELKGFADGRHGFAFSVFTVRPQTHAAVWITSSCRRTPDRDEPDGPFTLPSLVPHVPANAPVWGPRSPEGPPYALPLTRHTESPAKAPADQSAEPTTRSPDAGTLARIRDLLG